MALVIFRRPDVIFNAQFHTEDARWFAEAYDYGWRQVLFEPYSGYLVLFEHLGGALSLLAPVRFAPLLMNLIGIGAQALPALFLISSRSKNLGSTAVRICMAAAYFLLPSCSEINVTLTSAQWHLSLLACLVILATAPPNTMWLMFDLAVIAMSGLAGPYCLILIPIAVVYWFVHPDRRKLSIYLALWTAAIMQLTTMLVMYAIHATWAMGGRTSYPLGASTELFVRLLGGQVFLNALIGSNNLALDHGLNTLLVSLMMVVLGLAVLLYTGWNAQLEIKLLIIFCNLIYLASLRSPIMSASAPQWLVMAGFPGCRYFFFPMLAFVWSLVWCLAKGHGRTIRALAALPLIILCVYLPKTWRYPADPDFAFPKYAKELESAKVGTVIRVPVYPGGDWVIFLKRH